MLVKVWNLNKHEHAEKFRGKEIIIPANSYTQMEYHEAVDFLGQFYPPRYNKAGLALPESFKRLEIDGDDLKAARLEAEGKAKSKADKTFVCGLCNEEFPTKAKLIKHVAKAHKDRLVDPDELEDAEDAS